MCPVELGAFRQRALLGLLLANAGTVLSTDRILDELWGETGGTDKQGSLWVYVSGLRGALEPGRAKRSEGTILLTRAPGYVLVGRPGRHRCRSVRAVSGRGPGHLGRDRSGWRRRATLRAGLAMWRGHAYEEFAYESWAQAEIARLEELRLEAIEDRIDADLRLGAVPRAGVRAAEPRPPAPAAGAVRHVADAGAVSHAAARRGASRVRRRSAADSSPRWGSSRRARCATSSIGSSSTTATCSSTAAPTGGAHVRGRG